MNQQCVVYSFQCDLCDASYVGYTLRHLHQRVSKQKNVSSSIGKHYKEKHSTVSKDLEKQFSVLKKCNDKFDCLVHEMLLIRELTCSLHVQSDSFRGKLFAWLLRISYMLINSQKKPFWQFISKHFELGNGVKMTPKRHSFLPVLFLTCFYKIIMPCNNFHGIANAMHIIQCTCKWRNEHASIQSNIICSLHNYPHHMQISSIYSFGTRKRSPFSVQQWK